MKNKNTLPVIFMEYIRVIILPVYLPNYQTIINSMSSANPQHPPQLHTPSFLHHLHHPPRSQQLSPQFIPFRPQQNNFYPSQIETAPKSNLADVYELSQDLGKLKEQLKKLAQKGQEFTSSKDNRDYLHSSIKSNLSADHIPKRRQKIPDSYQYHPSPFEISNYNSQPHPPQVNQSNQQIGKKHFFNYQHRSKRDKAGSFTGAQKAINETTEAQRFIKLELKLESEIKELKQKVSSLQNQLEISKLQQQNLRIELKGERKLQNQLKEQLKNSKEDFQARLSEIKQEDKIHRQKDHDSAKANMIIQKLQNEITQMKSHQLHSFNEALKGQLEENKILRQRLEEKDEQISHLKDELTQNSKKAHNLKSELSVLQVKAATELRSKQQRLQIQLSDRSNELQTVKRALETLQLKYRVAVREIGEKDEFIMNYLVNRSKQNDKDEVKTIMEKYIVTFPENRTMDNLLSEQKKIQELSTLLRSLTSCLPE